MTDEGRVGKVRVMYVLYILSMYVLYCTYFYCAGAGAGVSARAKGTDPRWPLKLS